MSGLRRLTALFVPALAAAFLLAPPASAQVIASDNFNRANEVPFSISGNWGRVIAGNYDGVSHLVGNQVTGVSNEGIYYWTGPGTFDPTRQFARQRVVSNDGEIGLVLLGGADQAIMVAWGPPGVNDTVYIYWYSEGQSNGQLTTGPSSVNNGDIIEAVLDGGVIYAKVNGVTVKSVANTTTLTSGVPGFITYLNPELPTDIGILDDWEAGTPASYALSGTITEDSAGLSGVLVTASGGFSGSATTDGDGDYTISGVPGGAVSIVLTPTLVGHTMTPTTRNVPGPLAADVTGQNFTSELLTGATLTINATHGTVTKTPDQPSYNLGTVVTLTPVPAGGYSFASWSGNVPPGDELDNPLQLTMDQNRVITANFLAEGLIASDDFNRANEIPFAVGGNWQAVAAGASHLVNQAVTGASGDAVYFWQGPGTFSSTRQFARATLLQTGGQGGLVLLGGPGRGIVTTWNGGQFIIYWYQGGSNQGQLANVAAPVQNGDEIEAVLDQGRIFATRNGVVIHSVANTTGLPAGTPGFETFLTGATLDDWEAGTPPTQTISGTITENASALAGVTVTATGSFSGSTTTDANGVYQFASVPFGVTSVVLTPSLSGYTFSPSSRTVTGPLTADVTGQDFTGSPITGFVLTVNATHGSVTKNPDLTSYDPGTIVTLTPVPNGGYSFAGWSGDVPPGDELDNPLQLTMNQNRVITANFLAEGLIAADDFNRANEIPFVVGGNWQAVAAGASHLVNQAVTGASGDAVYFWQGPGTFSSTRQFARATLLQTGGQGGLVLLGGPGRGIVTTWNGGQFIIYWYQGGSNQGQLANVAAPVQNGDEIEAVLDQGRIFATRNGVVIHSVANTTGLPAGTPGFETFLTGATLDGWEAGTPPTQTISGTITENASALAGVTVTATGSFSGSTTTDANGVYQFASVPFGVTSVVLTPSLSGYTFSPSSRTVTGPLTADVTGQDFTGSPITGFVLTVNATHGSVTKNPDLTSYDPGTIVTLTPVPNGGYSFAGWSGDVPPGDELDNPLQLTMNQNRVITANFLAEGLIAADDFNRANEIPFVVGGNWQAVAAGASHLVNQAVTGASGDAVYFWQGPGTFSSTRQFARATLLQTGGQGGLVLLGGPGRGIVTTWAGGQLIIYWYQGGSIQGQLANVAAPVQNGDQIQAVLDQGRIFATRNGVVIHSVANTTGLPAGTPGFETFLTGATLDGWEAGTPPTQTISGTITENASALAGVTVTATGSFSGSTTTDANGAYQFASVPFGVTSVVLTPSLSGYTFSPSSRTVTGPLTADVTGRDFAATANAGAVLTIIATHGTVTRNPDLSSYPFGTNVTLAPVADPGYRFVTWTGDVPPGDETDNPLVVAMTQDRTITAVFISTDALAWDNFDRPDETPVLVGGNWVKPLGLGISNLTNQQIVGSGANDSLYHWQGAGTFDGTRQFARSTATQAGGQVGLVLLGAPGQGIVVAWKAPTLYIYWYTGGISQGNLATFSSTLQNGDRIEALLDNGTIFAKINGTVVASVANTTTLSTGRPGFETFESGGAFDDWEAGPTPGECAGQPDGTPCNDGESACTVNDTCQGGVCVGTPLSCDDVNPCTVDSCTAGVGCQNVPGNAGTVCRASAGQCDVAETCTGAASACPADAFASSATTCTGSSQGGACDLTDHCSGTANTCVDAFQPSSFECRPAIDGCDVAESCTGSSGACPADAQSPLLGNPCDGADSDLCAEGVNICVEGAIACDDATGNNLDLCNGADDDCDPASADGSEDPAVGVACDGTDSDLCAEGLTACTGGVISCTDATGDNLDVCNGADDDCDPASADGSEDPAVGVACDGTDSDLCAEGLTACTGGVISCTDATGDNLDVCNGANDDCDPASADGSEDPAVGVACDGTDSDLCAEGLTACTAGSIACGDVSPDTHDVCNGADDDCDPSSDDGSEDLAVGLACDGVDSDLCIEGTTVCTAGAIACTDTTSDTVDVCNGLDDDCDPSSADGSEDPGVGVACDGTDSDLCAEGVTACTGGVISCTDATGDNLDVCNGADDDCDPASADGAEDPGLGAACDGADSDLCIEGTTVCTAGALACTDTTSDNLDLCNGLDDDCDSASADGSEDPGVGVSCDGTDSDLCNEGTTVCTAGSIACTDVTGNNLDACNGADDDCDPASADGAEDPGLGAACDGADSDLCIEGTTVCTAGALACTDTTSDNLDLCNGLDDDCDSASADGSEDPGVGVACDGTDSDLCNEGTTVCTAGSIACSDVSGDNLDVCNGADDDCDPASADGAEDPGLGVACDGADSDLCIEGTTVCTAGAIACSDATSDNLDLCNGLDDDCDPASADGSEDPGVGVACDGTDSDLCAEGLTACTGSVVSCTDVTGNNLDACNGVDDDCDPASADGSEDAGVGVACDGTDSDLCAEGVTACTAGAVSCTDTTGNNLDVCNGLDDDCDPASADGAEDSTVGVACDGVDSDLCIEGATVCAAGAVACSDTTGSTVDLCNGLNDDCDPASVDGSEDPGVAIACDGPDGDLCAEGISSCAAGAIACSDATGTTVEVCNGLDDDCDGGTDETGAALCDDGNTCNGLETCGGSLGCQLGTPPASAIVVSVPPDVTAVPGVPLVVPILAQPATGSTIDLTLTYNPAHLQPVSAATSLLTAGAALTTDLSVSGEVRISIVAGTPIFGAGPLVFVSFNVLAPVGTSTPLAITRSDVDLGALAACHLGAQPVGVWGDPQGEVTSLTVSGKTSTQVSWTKFTGGFHRYDLASGSLETLRVDRSAIAATCLVNDSNQDNGTDTRPGPSLGSGYYYIVRSQGSGAKGSYGSGTSRPAVACRRVSVAYRPSPKPGRATAFVDGIAAGSQRSRKLLIDSRAFACNLSRQAVGF